MPTSKKAQTKIDNKSAREVSKERLRRITKARKHRIRTTGRVVKYGAKSFARNTWLSAAAIAIMAITLIVLGATIIATDVMKTTIREVESQVDISVYIKQEATLEQVERIIGRMTQLETVTDVSYVTPEDANRNTIENLIRDNNITDETMISELYDAPNALPWTLNIKLVSLDDTSELENFVNNDESTKDMLDARPPSYANKNRETIDQIAHIMNRIQLIVYDEASRRKQMVYYWTICGRSGIIWRRGCYSGWRSGIRRSLWPKYTDGCYYFSDF